MSKRIAVFNDTSVTGHYGCDAVMTSIRTLAAEHGVILYHLQPLGESWEKSSAAIQAIKEVDIVLVNGEGSIHHSSSRAKALSELAPYCRERKKSCHLINATVEENSAEIYGNLREFSSIWVRESYSQRELAKRSIRSEICPDLSIYNLFPQHQCGDETILVIDSVDQRTSKMLLQFAVQSRGHFVSMRRERNRCICYQVNRRIPAILMWAMARKKPVSGVSHFKDFAAYMADHRAIVTGRFHGFCMAVAMHIPMVVVQSNTWKCEAMLRDIGLDRDRVIRARAPVTVPPFSDSEKAQLHSYLSWGRRQIQSMFRTVVSGN